MKIKMLALAAMATATVAMPTVVNATPAIDVAQFPTGYFAPSESATYDSPYYRYWDEDWSWTHGAVATPFSTADLLVSGFDVDFGEVDQIYAKDNGVWVLLGDLDEAPDSYSYTSFSLGANFFDDILAGLEVRVDIDVTHNYDFWALTLGKSTLSLDKGTPPAANPGVPEPGTWAMMIGGFAAIGSAMRRRKVAVSFA